MTDEKRYFAISKYPTNQNATDIGFTPIGNGKVPDDYLAFKTDVELVIRTIDVIYTNDREKFKKYYDQLFSITRACYSGKEEDLLPAMQELADIKKTILTSSWVNVRNHIMGWYGFFALITAAFFSLLKWYFNFSPLNIPVILIGCCIGSWLSVSIKTSSIKFDEIYENIGQYRSIFLRLIYCCVLAVAFSTFLFAGFIEIKIGEITTKMIPGDDVLSVATGLVFGIGESSLASKLSDKVKEALS